MIVYIVDAFTDKLFSGNNAAVCPLKEWLPDALMQQIAFENNLAETTFVVQEKEGYRIRWFTPAVEVDLCGHATLAAAHVLMNHLGYATDKIVFNSRSGKLMVIKTGNALTLDFPADSIMETTNKDSFTHCFSLQPKEIYKGKTDYLFVFETQKDIEQLIPNLDAIARLDARGVIVTAKGDEADFVSRFFAPQSGINEDPVTGSAHTTLTPYWSRILGKNTFKARQLSARGGELGCELLGDRVLISGQAVTYLIGDIQLNHP